VRGPNTAYAAAACSVPRRPSSWLPGQTPKMAPTAQPAAKMLEPSSGSQATCAAGVRGLQGSCKVAAWVHSRSQNAATPLQLGPEADQALLRISVQALV